jgi:hypothetical protein
MFSGAVLVRSDAQFDFEELSLIARRVGVTLSTLARADPLLFDDLMVVAFALGSPIWLLFSSPLTVLWHQVALIFFPSLSEWEKPPRGM